MPGSSFALAPSTGEYAKQPARSMRAFADEVEQVLELGLGLAGKAGDEGAADDELRADLAPARQPLEVLLAARRPLHPRSTSGCECWNGTSR
jgi:hypothetical protein